MEVHPEARGLSQLTSRSYFPKKEESHLTNFSGVWRHVKIFTILVVVLQECQLSGLRYPHEVAFH